MNPLLIDFITKILSDTMRLDFHYHVIPYSTLPSFDRNLRDSLDDSDLLYKQVQDFLLTMEANTFYFITDNYLIHYIFFFPFAHKRDIITIGPYFNQSIDDEYWNEVTEKNHLTSTNIQNIKGFLYGIPHIENNLQLISVVSNLVSYISNEGTLPFSIKYQAFNSSSDDNFLFTPKDNFDAYSSAVFHRYQVEKELLNHVSNGNWEDALIVAEKFMSVPIEPRLKNTLRDQKSMLISTNTLFRKSIERNKIHPVYLHEISSKYVNKIEFTTSGKALDKLYEQMIREYCLLVQNKSRDMYSLPVRKILNYIEFHINTPLTLQNIAEKFDLSAPYISSQFKKEVGVTIIKYINQMRVRNSLELLESSTISIQDIAAYVGVSDYNYFTKVFKKEMGVTPSEYRKNSMKI